MLEQLFERISSPREALVHELKDIYDAEQQIVAALPAMIERATRPELSAAQREHLDVTRAQVERVAEALRALRVEPARATCAGMRAPTTRSCRRRCASS